MNELKRLRLPQKDATTLPFFGSSVKAHRAPSACEGKDKGSVCTSILRISTGRRRGKGGHRV